MKIKGYFLFLMGLFLNISVQAVEKPALEILSSQAEVCAAEEGSFVFWSRLRVKNNTESRWYVPVFYHKALQQNFSFTGVGGINEITAAEDVLYTHAFLIGSGGGRDLAYVIYPHQATEILVYQAAISEKDRVKPDSEGRYAFMVKGSVELENEEAQIVLPYQSSIESNGIKKCGQILRKGDE